MFEPLAIQRLLEGGVSVADPRLLGRAQLTAARIAMFVPGGATTRCGGKFLVIARPGFDHKPPGYSARSRARLRTVETEALQSDRLDEHIHTHVVVSVAELRAAIVVEEDFDKPRAQ